MPYRLTAIQLFLVLKLLWTSNQQNPIYSWVCYKLHLQTNSVFLR